jgi:ornithine cyclodeaminase
LPGLSLRSCASVAEAVRGADIVTTATADKRNALILTPEMIGPGMHLNAVGGDCPGKTELHPDILRRPDARIVVEFEPQARIEGEIQQLDAAVRVMEIADVVSGKTPARRGPMEVSIFDSVGFALNDFSSLRYLHRLDREVAGGSVIDLIPGLDDPKVLFGELKLGSSSAKPKAPALEGSAA